MDHTLVFALCILAFFSGALSMFFWDGENDETEHETGSVLQ